MLTPKASQSYPSQEASTQAELQSSSKGPGQKIPMAQQATSSMIKSLHVIFPQGTPAGIKKIEKVGMRALKVTCPTLLLERGGADSKEQGRKAGKQARQQASQPASQQANE